jgi:deferrochelatase/peroxidase EfeB
VRGNQRDPAGLGSSDALNEYIKHTGSAIFAIPPGARRGGYVGETLLG